MHESHQLMELGGTLLEKICFGGRAWHGRVIWFPFKVPLSADSGNNKDHLLIFFAKGCVITAYGSRLTDRKE